MKTYKIITYGCQANISDSERIKSLFSSLGYKESDKKANFVFINMCSVRQSAVDKAISKSNEFKNNRSKTILTGCILKKDKDKLKNKADFILDINDLYSWPEKINGINKKTNKDYFKLIPERTSSVSALIPITTGCNNFCSYCAVPYTRGRERSRKLKEIIKEAEKAVKENYKEIWFLGQNVNSYKDESFCFSDLLEKTNSIPGNFWIRFLSSHPKDFDKKLAETINSCEKVTEFLNFPVQSGDDEILKKMNRPYTVNDYKKKVKTIRKEIIDVSLFTDIIVGFPGETKKNFKNTARLLKEIEFDMGYIAKYSPRPGTAASLMKDTVSPKEKKERHQELTEILTKTALKNNQKFEKKIVEVLVQEKKENFFLGKTRGYKTVKIISEEDLLNSIIKVKIEKAFPWGLKGEKI